jgi:hypothetical protein
MMSTTPQRRPIGFWLKLVDGLIDEHLGAVLAGAALTRRQWQILNVLHQHESDLASLDQALEPFLSETEPTVDLALGELVESGWATHRNGAVEMTDMAREGFAEVQRAVSGMRQRMGEHVGAESYATTIGTLEQMARNLGWDGGVDDSTA